jgi:hypothetical protein
MNLSKRMGRLLAAAALTAGLGAAAVGTAAAPAFASTTTCKTFTLEHVYWTGPIFAQPWEYVPVCWNGSTVWQNGHITAGYSLVGYTTSGVSWAGTYNDASHQWLGMGMNLPITTLGIKGFTASTLLTPRWYVNAHGVIYAFGSS